VRSRARYSPYPPHHECNTRDTYVPARGAQILLLGILSSTGALRNVFTVVDCDLCHAQTSMRMCCLVLAWMGATERRPLARPGQPRTGPLVCVILPLYDRSNLRSDPRSICCGGRNLELLAPWSAYPLRHEHARNCANDRTLDFWTAMIYECGRPFKLTSSSRRIARSKHLFR
jgi:hypothetical protein